MHISPLSFYPLAVQPGAWQDIQQQQIQGYLAAQAQIRSEQTAADAAAAVVAVAAAATAEREADEYAAAVLLQAHRGGG